MANYEIIKKEVKFITSRSSGAGGQHVNKVESRVQLVFDIKNSNGLNDRERELLLNNLKKRINSEGYIQISNQQSRSQLKNKAHALDSLVKLIHEGLKEKKKRKKTSVPKAEKEKRLKDKKIKSELKEHRKKIKPIL